MIKPRQPRYAQIFCDPEDAEKSDAMCKTAVTKWSEVIEHLRKNDWITAGRIAVADRYARAYAEYEYLYPIAVKEGPVKKGPNGGDVFNFNWSTVEKLNERLSKLEAKLRIDPADGSVERPPETPKTAADAYLG